MGACWQVSKSSYKSNVTMAVGTQMWRQPNNKPRRGRREQSPWLAVPVQQKACLQIWIGSIVPLLAA